MRRLVTTSAMIALGLSLGSPRGGAVSLPHFEVPVDRVQKLIDGLDTFLKAAKNEDGISPDERVTDYPTELIRLNVVPQLLGYYELYRLTGKDAYKEELTTRARYLVKHFDRALRKRAYDGMVGYALLAAYEVTKAEEFKVHGEKVTQLVLQLSNNEMRLNRGLMGAMSLAKSYELTKKPELLKRLGQVLDALKREQNPDGSFPHAYDGRDVHYSSWMAMQLALIRRSIPSDKLPRIEEMLEPLVAYIATRIDQEKGEPRYTDEVCDERGRCRYEHHYAQATASQPEYDTRGWSNELGYEVFALGTLGHPKEGELALKFLETLSNDGAFPDKWDYPVDPSSDQYPFSIEKRSILRSSLIFWCLAAALTQQ